MNLNEAQLGTAVSAISNEVGRLEKIYEIEKALNSTRADSMGERIETLKVVIDEIFREILAK